MEYNKDFEHEICTWFVQIEEIRYTFFYPSVSNTKSLHDLASETNINIYININIKLVKRRGQQEEKIQLSADV